VVSRSFSVDGTSLRELERRFSKRAREVAIFLVYDRPDRINERPELARSFFAERCVSDDQLARMIEVYRSVGAYVELFEGEKPFIEALTNGHIASIARPVKLVYDGSEGGVLPGGFKPGRKSLIPVVADAYGLTCANSNAYACAIGRHKFHYATLLRSMGIHCPRTWHFRPDQTWAANGRPPLGVRVIAKSTFESWSVGISADSVFVVDNTCDDRVREIAERIGQAVTVQEFIGGREVSVPLFACPHLVVGPPVQALLARAPVDPDAIVTIDDHLAEDGVSYPQFDSDTALTAQLQQDTVGAFDALELEHFARLDFRVDASDCPWLFDVAVSPGISRQSAAYSSLSHLDLAYPEFLRVVIGATLAADGLI
jgi:D-alanine-D-alanine ligase